MRRRWVVALGPCLLLVLLASPIARAEEEVLKLVPDSALGLVVLNGLANVDGKIQELGRTMRLPIPGLLARFKEHAGITEGLDETHPVLLAAISAGTDSAPAPLLLVPVTDYAKLVAQFKPEDTKAKVTKIELLGVEAYVRRLGHYAALTDAQHREVVEKLKPAREVPAALVPLSAWLAEHDAAGVLLRPGIERWTAQGIEGLRKLQETFRGMGDQMKGASAGFEVYIRALEALDKQTTAVALGLKLDKDGTLAANARVRLVSGGAWDRFAASLPAPSQNLIAGLPAGSFVFAAGGTLSDATWDSMVKFSMGFIKAMPEIYGLSPEKAKELGDFKFPPMKGLHGIAVVMGVPPSGKSLYARTVAVMKVDDAAAFLAVYEKSIGAYSDWVKKLGSPMLQPMVVERTKVGKAEALQLSMKLPQMPSAEGNAQVRKMMETMFGPGGKLDGWLVPADEHTLVFAYIDKEHLEEAVAAIQAGKAGLAGDPDVAKTAALLPPHAPWVGYWSFSGTVELISHIMAAVLGPMGGGVKLPEVPASPPVGIAVTTAPGEIRIYKIVPSATLEALGTYIGLIQAMGGRPPAIQE